MPDLTPEQKLQNELNDKFHAAMINDQGIRKTFIKAMTGDGKVTDEEMDSIHRFVIAVDYMLGTLGYGICDMYAKDGPVHLSEIVDFEID